MGVAGAVGVECKSRWVVPSSAGQRMVTVMEVSGKHVIIATRPHSAITGGALFGARQITPPNPRSLLTLPRKYSHRSFSFKANIATKILAIGIALVV